MDTEVAATQSPAGRYGTIIDRYASTYGVPVSLANAVIRVESNYRPDVRGRAGEVGLMQIKPATARMMGYSGSTDGLFHPETNIKFGMKYLAKAHRAGRRHDLRHHPEIQCRTRGHAHEPGVVGLLQQGQASPGGV